jgi:hypothetical protein
MKKIILLILAVVLLFGLGACNPDDPDTRKTGEAYINPSLVE